MKRRALSFKYAFNGIFRVFRDQPNFRIETGLGILAIILGIILNISELEWVIVVLLIALVLSAEIFNTMMEDIASRFPVDHIRETTKDKSAGFVLVLAIASAVIGGIIFVPKILLFL